MRVSLNLPSRTHPPTLLRPVVPKSSGFKMEVAGSNQL
jgi:hypothetical protein